MVSKKIKEKVKEEDEKIIAKVWKFSHSGQKCVTIPKGSSIENGEYVVIQKVELPKIKKGDLMKLKRC